MLVRDLMPLDFDRFTVADAVRVDTKDQWWLKPDAEVFPIYSEANPIKIQRSDDGFIATQPDPGGCKMNWERSDEYKGYFKLLYAPGKYLLSEFKRD